MFQVNIFINMSSAYLHISRYKSDKGVRECHETLNLLCGIIRNSREKENAAALTI